MTELLERAVDALRRLPPETQDALARILLQWVEDDASIVWLSADEEETFRASSLEPEGGGFATGDEIRAILGEPGSAKPTYTRRAAEELDQVLSYIEGRSSKGARHVKARIQAAIDLIASYPHSGQPTSTHGLRRVVDAVRRAARGLSSLPD
jgi:plasmid stabilization system protein ParE